MKVILLADVHKVGKKYEVKDVASGYALNMLIPLGKAKVATPPELKKLDALKAEMAAEDKVQLDLLEKNFSEINGKTVKCEAPSNEQGHLFAALHKADIIKKIKEETGVDVSPDHLLMEKNIKEKGSYPLTLSGSGKKAEFTLEIA